MAERRSSAPGKGTKSQRSLSVTKSKRGGSSRGTITTFFSNAPPSKLACPLCSELVPRFKINEHIDSQCQKFLGGNNSQDALVCDNKETTAALPLSPTTGQALQRKQELSTSPYFKMNSHAKVVETISTGSLSSKLSRKALKFPEGLKEETGESSNSIELNSSQKENQTKERCLTPQRPTAVCCSPDKSDHKTAIPEPRKTDSASALKRNKKEQNSSNKIKTKRRKYEQSHCEQVGNIVPEPKTESLHYTENSPVNSPVPASDDLSSDIHTKKVTHAEKSYPQSTVNKDSSTSDPVEVDLQHHGPGAPLVPRVPYYLRNFLSVLETVLENEDDRMLFKCELGFLTFLSGPGQMLYVRLFQRKFKWLPVNKLDYAEIGSDLKPVTEELVNGGFIQAEKDLQELGEVLDLLPAPELKSLAKTFHLGGCGSGTQKQQLVEGLLRLGKQRSLFALAPGQSSTGAVILKRAKHLAGPCVRLCREARAVFSRLLLLFSLTDTLEEEEMGSGGHGQLYTILLVNSGRLAFPSYTVQRMARLFRDRDDLIRYEAAICSLQEVITAMQAGCWEDALGLYTSAKATWQELKQTCDLSYEEQLPVFLRCFTVGWTYTRILSRGVEILQRLRRYEDSVEVLKTLLAQSVYCPDSRGRWWDRLALNLQQHLKLHEEAIGAIRDGLSDPLVRTGHQLSLHQRAARMRELTRFKKFHRLLRDLPAVHVQDVTHVTIRGQLFPHAGGMGKSVFLRAEDESAGEEPGTMVMCSVEDLALAHYRQLGFDQGIHGEGSTFSTLFGLLMWDIIFMDGVHDVFRNPYQTCPLDLHTDCFYENRSEAIEARVQMLQEASVETLQALLADVWWAVEGRVCSLVNWERFSSLQHAQSLVACLRGHFISRLVLRMAKDYRHCRAGLPDLVVWNTSNNTCKLVEVKGPNDRLSQKQQIWLDELRKMGADVEVCHVTAIGSRGHLS
uniref:Fanconi-associated nuclease n=1 Tax=Denticeps clupeoides TaxID=299321 RepID=A0AAY4B3Q9_9TELE